MRVNRDVRFVLILVARPWSASANYPHSLAEALLSADARLPTGSVAGGESLLRHPANRANVARVSGACRR